MTRNRIKLGRKSKHKKEHESNIVDNDEESKNKTPDETHLPDSPTRAKQKEKSAKKVHIAFLPEKYEPLVEEEDIDSPKEDSVKKRRNKYKKFRKNVGKGLRYSWKCLLVGLQNISLGYSMPVSAIVPEMHRARCHV